MTSPDDLAEVRERVRARYADAAATVLTGGTPTCGQTCSGEEETGTGAALYSGTERDEVPGQAVTASLGCGNPVAVADLRLGETVLDLGSGGGLDVLLSARRVGPAGRAYGLDMTDEMLSVARANARTAGAANVEFLKGRIEAIPLPDQSVDVIISNCVINLSGDKAAVLAESFRVLRPGGRLGVSDILAEDHLTTAERIERGRQVGAIAGALSFADYRDGLAQAGFTAITITPTHLVADGLHSAVVRAVRP
jgi:arsenite methyltransferase